MTYENKVKNITNAIKYIQDINSTALELDKRKDYLSVELTYDLKYKPNSPCSLWLNIKFDTDSEYYNTMKELLKIKKFVKECS